MIGNNKKDEDKSSLISIVMPSYNHGEFISKSIDSIIDQSYTNWELIIIDNNSKDNTKQVLSNYNSNKQIKVLYVNHNGLIGYSRNKGIKASKGKYIAFIDSDDIWYRKKLELCLPYLNEFDFIFHKTEIFLNEEQVLKNSNYNPKTLGSNVTKNLLLNGNQIVNSSVITKKSILLDVGCIDETKEINRSVDYHTWLKISTKTNKFKMIDKYLGKNIIHNTNLSNVNMMKSTMYATNEFKSHLNYLEKKILKSRILYINNKYLYDKDLFRSISIKSILYCIVFGRRNIKLKSTYILFKILIGYFKN